MASVTSTQDSNGCVDVTEFQKLLVVLFPDPKTRAPNPKKSFVNAGAQEKDGVLVMERSEFIQWATQELSKVTEDKQANIVQKMISTQDPGADYTTKSGVLKGARRRQADKLFKMHDVDSGGALSFEEFMSFIVVYDPGCLDDGVRDTFMKMSTDGEMDCFQFYEWVHLTFGSLDDNEFDQGDDAPVRSSDTILKGMSELTLAAEAAILNDFSNVSEASQLRLMKLRLSITQSALTKARDQLGKLRSVEENNSQLTERLQELGHKTEALQHENSKLLHERTFVLEHVGNPETCSTTPFIELDDAWHPLMQLVTRYSELELVNKEFALEIGRLQHQESSRPQVKVLEQQIAVLQGLMHDMRTNAQGTSSIPADSGKLGDPTRLSS
eukprot:TRINITY_DN13998_c0_g1_i5.p1 TRINITY_DN13998_c0_g1~~TRINITY_DN13998_c0_g1_i5.p1  ORF type:complete len:384 (-),score=54.46 TRINITY_DN13998_c0_g1_i5:96-1247(-)